LMRGQHRVERAGVVWDLDLRCWAQRSVFYFGWFERNETRFFEACVQPGWTVVDAGANFGYYSLLAGKKVTSSGCVHAFEPSTPVYEQLVNNIRLNSIGWVHPAKVALGDTERVEVMPIPERYNQTLQGIGSPGQPNTEEVKVRTLDSFAADLNIQAIHLIKADIEGYEVHFLKGAREVIREFRPILMLELNPATLERYGACAEDLIGLVTSYGYEIFEIEGRQLRKLAKVPRHGSYINAVAFHRKDRRSWLFV
ncbi:MAG: FkbM family methyltransferase, partial [Terriglobia bacterium]